MPKAKDQNNSTVAPASPTRHASKTTTSSSRKIPSWRSMLYARGLSDSTIDHFDIRPDGGGWEYPIHPSINAKRWKAFDSYAEPKYLWAPGMPDDARFYGPDGKLDQYIAEADGVLWLMTGEGDVWAAWEAGIRNATCLLLGEGSNIPEWFDPDLKRRGVKTVRTAPDRDKAGRSFARNVKEALRDSGTALKLYKLPPKVGLKGDVGKLLLKVGAGALKETLLQLPELKVSPASPKPEPKRKRVANTHAEPSKLYEEWCLMVETEAVNRWQISRPNGKEFSSRNIRCPNPGHADKNPSASWNFQTHGVHCFVCGEFNTEQVAEMLGVQSWKEFKADHSPTKPRSSRKKQPAETNGSRAVSPAEDHSPAAKEVTDDREVEVIPHTSRREPKMPPPTHDEMGDELILKWDGNQYLFHDQWQRYENGCWRPDKTVKAQIWAVMRGHKARGISPTRGQATSIEGYLEATQSLPDDLIDQADAYINLQNGLFNLDTGELEPHQRELYLTSQLPFAYDPADTCPLWLSHLDQWLTTEDGRPDPALIAILQEAFGYSLTADVSFEKAFWAYGPAGSGKSTVLKVLSELAGSSQITLDLSALDRNQYQLADLPGKRIVICTEAQAGGALADEKLKQIISGEEILARQIYHVNSRFKPQAKIWWAMNERPTNRDRSNAIYRRLILIPFRNAIPAEKQDRALFQKLKAELPGIFNWAMEGLQRLRQNDAFTPSSQAAQALEEYRQENDVERAFLEDSDWCVLDPDRRTQASDLYKAYKLWCETYGHHYRSSTKVARDWERLRLTKYKNGTIQYSGVALKPTVTDAIRKLG